jgi:steroid delta-isomerase-like uncharacterized protein
MKGEHPMSLEENKAVMRRFVEEVQCQHNLAAVDELFSPDMVDYSGTADPPTREGAHRLFAMMFAAFPDLHVTIRQQIAEGDKVVTHKTFHGTHAGPFMGIPATGREVTFDVIDIVTVQGGQMTEHWMVGDMLGVVQQLSPVPAP